MAGRGAAERPGGVSLFVARDLRADDFGLGIRETV